MPTKHQQEIAELTRSHLRDGEQILHYGEAKPPYPQALWFRLRQWDLQTQPIFSAIKFILKFILAIVIVLMQLLFCLVMILASIALGIDIAHKLGSLAWMMILFMVVPLTIAALGLTYRVIRDIRFFWDGVFSELPAQYPIEDEIFQNVSYIITSQRILVFDKDGLAAYPLALLTDIVLDKPQNGLSSISFYTSKTRKPKLPEPKYRLLDIPEEEAQTAYQILQEARDYDARVRERNMWLEAEQKRKMGME
jgi:hypothetical protein